MYKKFFISPCKHEAQKKHFQKSGTARTDTQKKCENNTNIFGYFPIKKMFDKLFQFLLFKESNQICIQ